MKMEGGGSPVGMAPKAFGRPRPSQDTPRWNALPLPESDETRKAMKDVLSDASRRAIKYLEGLADRPVAPSPAAVAGLAALDEPLPQKASDPSETLRLLDE